MALLRYKTYIGAASLLLLSLTACDNRPVDADAICRAALQGTDWGSGANYQRCLNDVSLAGYKAAHKAAAPYRAIER